MDMLPVVWIRIGEAAQVSPLLGAPLRNSAIIVGQIRYQTGDIFTSSAQVIVNPVNCRGVMGAGLARAFKQRYPEMFAAGVLH
jgi:hypothetical protein